MAPPKEELERIMSSIKVSPDAARNVSPKTLELAPARLLKLLDGAAAPEIRAQLGTVGWCEPRAKEGWSLFDELRAAHTLVSVPSSKARDEALAECERVQVTALVRVRALLHMSLPAYAEVLFGELSWGKGERAVLDLDIFVARCEMLASSPERSDTRSADREALAVIAEAGVTPASLKEMRALVRAAQQAAPCGGSILTMAAKRTEVLQKMHAYVTGWSELMRIVVTRRDQLIRLGIAKRRARKAFDAPDAAEAAGNAPASA